MRESRLSGSARGARSNPRPYRDLVIQYPLRRSNGQSALFEVICYCGPVRHAPPTTGRATG